MQAWEDRRVNGASGLSTRAGPGDNVDTAAHVLQLAQQAAEQAIADAQREAEEIRSRARQEAEQIIADAKARAQRL